MQRYQAQEFMKHSETWPCDCCGENRERAVLDAEGTGLCVECAIPLLTQQLAGAVAALEAAEDALLNRSPGSPLWRDALDRVQDVLGQGTDARSDESGQS